MDTTHPLIASLLLAALAIFAMIEAARTYLQRRDESLLPWSPQKQVYYAVLVIVFCSVLSYVFLLPLVQLLGVP